MTSRESVASELRQEFPELYALAEASDFAERAGGLTSKTAAEADVALRELWMARTNLAFAAADTTAPDLAQTIACIEAVLDRYAEVNASRENPSQMVRDLIADVHLQIGAFAAPEGVSA